MASTYKTFLSNDIATTKTLLHEAIPITGTIVSGTYADNNIKTYSHGMFQSVYDYPYLSSSANHIFDITYGYSNESGLSSSTNPQNDKKINIYNEFAQILMPYDIDGNIQQFDQDGNITDGGTKMDSCFFIPFSRLLTKDEIKKGTFRFTTAVSGSTGSVGLPCWPEPSPDYCADSAYPVIGDYGAATSYKVNSPTGEYGLLYTASTPANETSCVGHVYYQAGIVVLTGALYQTINFSSSAGGALTASTFYEDYTIDAIADGFRYCYNDVAFNNTTELNSTIYFCRANTADYNYSSNPTYLDGSKIRVKGNNSFEEPVSYLTTIGLYSSDNELMAVAKVSEPLKKTPSNELTLRVRLDY